MSDRSSDIPHEAILHTVVRYIRNLRQQVTRIQTDLLQWTPIPATSPLLVQHEPQITPSVEHRPPTVRDDDPVDRAPLRPDVGEFSGMAPNSNNILSNAAAIEEVVDDGLFFCGHVTGR